MEIKRCARCGGFFISENDVCANCLNQETKEIAKLKDYLNTYDGLKETTRNDVSNSTGISMKNLNRFLGNEEFSNVNIPSSIDNIKTTTTKVKIK